jgi:hypothetical protein
MKMSTTAKRIGLAQLEVVVKDFIGSGYLAMFTAAAPSHTFRVAENQTLELRYADSGKIKRIFMVLTNTRSTRSETVVYTIPRGDIAEISVTPVPGSQLQNYIKLAMELANAIVVVQDSCTVDGELRVSYPGGTGYSAIDGEGAAEAFVRMRNNGSPGVAN